MTRGWTTSRSPLLGDAVLDKAVADDVVPGEAVLAAERPELGIQVAAVPRTVPITVPPAPTLQRPTATLVGRRPS